MVPVVEVKGFPLTKRLPLTLTMIGPLLQPAPKIKIAGSKRNNSL